MPEHRSQKNYARAEATEIGETIKKAGIYELLTELDREWYTCRSSRNKRKDKQGGKIMSLNDLKGIAKSRTEDVMWHVFEGLRSINSHVKLTMRDVKAVMDFDRDCGVRTAQDEMYILLYEELSLIDIHLGMALQHNQVLKASVYKLDALEDDNEPR